MSENHARLFTSAVPGNDPPILLERMGVTTMARPTIFDRLKMSDVTLPSLQTADNMEPLLLGRLGMMRETIATMKGNYLQKTMTEENSLISKRNVSNRWTTLSRYSDPMKSRNSKRSQALYQSSTLTHPELSKQRTQLSNTMQRHSTRFKPSLLQRFGEEILPEMHWNQGKEVPTQRNLADLSTMTPKLMNLSPKSVETQRD